MSKKQTGTRPRIERKAFLQQVYDLAQLGVKDAEIRAQLNISSDAWTHWVFCGNRDSAAGRNSSYARFTSMLARARSSQTIDALRDLKAESKAGQWQASALLLKQNQAYDTERGTAGVNITLNDMRRIDITVLREAIASGDYDSLARLITLSGEEK